uniref:Uncharacterized protein n=1 Tax=Anguilla anguilla TaxID=7936 RepID=A0A0E9TKP6_ANGAN
MFLIKMKSVVEGLSHQVISTGGCYQMGHTF